MEQHATSGDKVYNRLKSRFQAWTRPTQKKTHQDISTFMTNYSDNEPSRGFRMVVGDDINEKHYKLQDFGDTTVSPSHPRPFRKRKEKREKKNVSYSNRITVAHIPSGLEDLKTPPSPPTFRDNRKQKDISSFSLPTPKDHSDLAEDVENAIYALEMLSTSSSSPEEGPADGDMFRYYDLRRNAMSDSLAIPPPYNSVDLWESSPFCDQEFSVDSTLHLWTKYPKATEWVMAAMFVERHGNKVTNQKMLNYSETTFDMSYRKMQNIETEASNAGMLGTFYNVVSDICYVYEMLHSEKPVMEGQADTSTWSDDQCIMNFKRFRLDNFEDDLSNRLSLVYQYFGVLSTMASIADYQIDYVAKETGGEEQWNFKQWFVRKNKKLFRYDNLRHCKHLILLSASDIRVLNITVSAYSRYS